ncbi:hypothetical protein KVR01_008944 [Diaporthe batatas]|uniref:uncharacterized protein n=1 Tax=Diaporthe batatas TaxID=748121 RepID=UPI001D0386B8|nr:uncharacterized protein KVR01_008944 [Diaporthe batatas]KAG8160680.1 hypothetical protein KVR01_008944 [Diaporthe batatas]
MPVGDTHPKPLVHEPTSGVHKHTLILLHGRGGSAATFGPALLNTPLAPAAARGTENTSASASSTPPPETNTSPHHGRKGRDCLPADQVPPPLPPRATTTTTLAQALPHARFVFPTAPRGRATVYRRSVVRQWFDDWHLGGAGSGDAVGGSYDAGLQTGGMGRAVAYLHDLVAREAGVVGGGARNVVLGGISQGCAVSLVASLLWEGDGLGGVVGMCGWLPYVLQMRGLLGGGEVDDDGDDEMGLVTASSFGGEEVGFDPFDRSASPGCDAVSPGGGSSDTGAPVTAALGWLRDEIEVPGGRTGSVVRGSGGTPAILCHGQDDAKVDVSKGEEAAGFLPALGIGPVRFETYAGVGHEFSADMLLDIVEFVQRVLE